MFWRFIAPRYAFKNFKSHMNIQQHQTLRGLLRKLSRQYPKAYRALQQALLLSTVYVMTMTLIPGSQLPFQKVVKMQQLNITCFFSKLWFYNMFTPSGGDYLIKLNETVLSAMNSQVWEMSFLEGYFEEIEWLVGVEKKKLKASNYFDLLLYSQLALQNIVRFENRLLLEPSLQNYYFWIYQTVLPEIARAKVTPKQEKHIKMFYTILQYLLNFAQDQQTNQCIAIYSQTIASVSQHTEQQFCSVIAKRALRQAPFLQLLKTKYAQTSNQEIKRSIISIFEKLDDIYSKK